jgi:chemotaxis family two-component system sensor kinase Cph1
VVTHDALPFIATDDTQLAQVFQNRVGNAIKYHGTEVPAVHISATQKNHEEWTFSVRDNGLGIEPQYFERIFILFNACTGVRNSRAQASGSQFAKRLWRDWAGEFGSSRSSAKAPRFILHCPRGIKTNDNDWSELRTDRSPVSGGCFEKL